MNIPNDSVVIRCNSHRARGRAGLSRNPDPRVVAVYSFQRACTGGYYIVPVEIGKEIISRNIPGVSKLRGPYDDLLRCW